MSSLGCLTLDVAPYPKQARSLLRRNLSKLKKTTKRMHHHQHQNFQTKPSTTIIKKDKKINVQSAQIKDLRLKLDQAVAENSQIRELLSPATLTTAISNALSATKTSFTSQVWKSSSLHRSLFLGSCVLPNWQQERMGLPIPTRPVVIVRTQGTCWRTVSGLKPENKFVAEKREKTEGGFKLIAPAPQGRGRRGGAELDPPSLTRFEDRFEQIVRTLSNLTSSTVTNETKQHILKRAVSQCPSITMEFLGLKVPSLLDSGSMVMLIREAYFNKNILPLLCMVQCRGIG